MFDYIHEFEQDVAIVEKTRVNSAASLHFRPWAAVQQALAKAGFTQTNWAAFNMPIDLPRPEDPSNVNSYTVRREDGSRMTFRGVLCQPWAHVWAQLGL